MTLDELFGHAVGLKLAEGGRWEQALRRPLGAGADDWLGRAGPDVGVEIAFESGAFVGLRLRPRERASAGRLLEALAALEPRTATAAMHAIDHVAEPRFCAALPAHAEVGVLDRWQSLGAIRIKRPVPETIVADVQGTPGGRALLASVLPAPLILEVAYGRAADAWLGAPVSSPRAHVLDPQRLSDVTRLLWRAQT